MHREVNGYWPAYFPQRKLVKDENITLEKAFWKMFFATRDIKEVEDFWWTYFTITTNMKDYYLEENEDEVRKFFRDTMEGQFEHDLINKSFSSQLESEDETDTLERRIKWWMLIIDRGGSILNNVYDHSFDELFGLYRKAIDPEMKKLAKTLRDRSAIP